LLTTSFLLLTMWSLFWMSSICFSPSVFCARLVRSKGMSSFDCTVNISASVSLAASPNLGMFFRRIAACDRRHGVDGRSAAHSPARRAGTGAIASGAGGRERGKSPPTS